MDSMDLGNMSFSVEKPGTKASSSSRPELTVGPTINKMSLNSLASKKMGLQNGDYVTILANERATNINEKYFITEGVGDNNQAKLASVNNAEGVGRTLNFNYSGTFSKMIQGTVDAMELSPEGLVEKGLAITRDTSKGNQSRTCLRKVFFEVGDGFDYELNGEEIVLYPLTNMKVKDYNPREMEDEGEAIPEVEIGNEASEE